jgi:hypothetical protein
VHAGSVSRVPPCRTGPSKGTATVPAVAWPRIPSLPNEGRSVLSALRVVAVLAGVAVGGLIATVAALILWAGFSLIGISDPPGAALVAGLVLGLLGAGYVAGRMAPVFTRFHGMVTGLAVTGLVVIIARLGGSPAPTPPVVALAAIGIALGGVGGVIGGRRRPADRDPAA